MPFVLERARRDLSDGKLWMARRRLEGFVGSKGYDRDVLELLGDVCWRMGDVPSAGRFWFFCSTDSEEKRNAIATFAREANGDASVVASRLPRRLRSTRFERFPIDVQDRLRALPIPQRSEQQRRISVDSRRGANLSKAYLAFGAMTLVGLFCLYCFSVGLAQLFNL